MDSSLSISRLQCLQVLTSNDLKWSLNSPNLYTTVKSIHHSYLEISCLEPPSKIFAVTPSADLRWPSTSSQNNRVNGVTIANPHSKCEKHHFFLPLDIVMIYLAPLTSPPVKIEGYFPSLTSLFYFLFTSNPFLMVFLASVVTNTRFPLVRFPRKDFLHKFSVM